MRLFVSRSVLYGPDLGTACIPDEFPVRPHLFPGLADLIPD
jgi:hypothetical protein